MGLLAPLIAAGGPLLFRGIYKLLMASELRPFAKFLEESAIAAFISREAALELLRRKLTFRLGRRLLREDVIDHIEAVFPTGLPFTAVLETDWVARVKMVHPVNDYEESWTPSVDAEECFDSINTCIYLLRYLLLDEIWVPAEYD